MASDRFEMAVARNIILGTMTEEQRERYWTAIACGADHEDAMEAAGA